MIFLNSKNEFKNNKNVVNTHVKMPAKAQPLVKKQKYIKKDPILHVLDRPDMYVGSIRSRKIEEYTVVDDAFHIEKRLLDISPAIIRMFIEPLSNVIDNVARSKQNKNSTTKIAIDINRATGTVSFWNDGDVIPVELHPEEKCYNHTLIFGQLLTGSNYDDENDDRIDVSGRNGLGGKVVNIFSKEFIVEGADPDNHKQFRQVWTNNMRDTKEPSITSYKLKHGFTKIEYTLDFKRFDLENYTDDIIGLYRRFAVDCAMITKVPIFLNGEEIPVKTLADYAKLYNITLKDDTEPDFIYIKTTDCEVVLTPTDDVQNARTEQVVSFANGIYTPQGGTHVDAWNEALFRPILEKLNKPKKPQLNITDVKRFFRLFVVATVKKPEFNSQEKSKLESPNVVAEVKSAHVKKILSWPVIERLEDIIRFKEMAVLKKSERKRGYETVEGLSSANNEGTAKAHECTLILVEGLSAKAYAVNAISKGLFGKVGRDWFGIYPLRGKLLNCRNAKPLAISKNQVVTDIIKALGVKYDVDYTDDANYKKLRYGKLLILTDQDVDGVHISGLIQNMFHSLFPSLLLRPDSYIISAQTPLVRVYTGGAGKSSILFYDEEEYKKYVAQQGDKKINKKYYKGLGSSRTADVIETFGQKLIRFKHDEKCFDTMNKAFHIKYADMRKNWLENYDPSKSILKWNGAKEEILDVAYSDFIDTELIKFSINDCKRSIPSIMDGLKEGHRKVLFYCLKKKIKKEIKVSQLAGYISAETNYHHGETNLQKTIASMACIFTGSNNIPYLYRGGQFGTRAHGGEDTADGRYIWTRLENITRLIYRPEDDSLLSYIEDDGDSIEPLFYVPIIPMILVNGSLGIGTGWSCNIPCFNPIDLIGAIRVWLDNDGKVLLKDETTTVSLLPELKPWYRGYTGEITSDAPGQFTSWGKVEMLENGKHRVTELPVGLWTENFEHNLKKLIEEKQIASFKTNSGAETVDFTITENNEGIRCSLDSLKLYKYIKTTNMVLFSDESLLKKFNTVDEIIDTFCAVRFAYYTKRKNRLLADLEPRIKFLGNKKRFLEEVRDGALKLFDEVDGKRISRKTADIVAELEKRGYDKDTAVEKEEKVEDEDEPEEKEKEKKGKHGYEYLLSMQISSITAEKITKLEGEILSCIKTKEELLITTERQMWERELDQFEAGYNKWLKEIADELKDLEKLIEKQKQKKKRV